MKRRKGAKCRECWSLLTGLQLKYCSEKCRDKVNHRVPRKIVKQCVVCRKKFRPRVSSYVTCSRKCGWKHLGRLRAKPKCSKVRFFQCANCKTFKCVAVGRKSKMKFRRGVCSVACETGLARKSYEDYKQSQQYQDDLLKKHKPKKKKTCPVCLGTFKTQRGIVCGLTCERSVRKSLGRIGIKNACRFVATKEGREIYNAIRTVNRLNGTIWSTPGYRKTELKGQSQNEIDNQSKTAK